MARLGLGLGLVRAPRRYAAGSPTPTPAPGPTPGTAATAFATAPSIHYHFDSQAVSVDGSNRLTNCPDLQGLANLFAVAGTTAPTLMTDALGRDFLRFNGAEAAGIANALTIASNRSFMALMVGRLHHANAICHFLNPRFAGYTSPTVNTQANSSIGYLRAVTTSNSAAFLQTGGPAASTNATDCYKVIPGAQLQVMAVASRLTASGGTRIYVNNDICDVAQQSTAVSNYVGGILGGTAGASNTEALTASAASAFDLYELAIWTTGPNNTDANAIVAQAVSSYAITQLDSQLVLDGDSITYGANTTLSESPYRSKGLASRLSEPGAGLIPGNVRVLNIAATGSVVSDLVTRRDATNAVFSVGKYPGGASRNVVAFQIGRNDMVTTPGTAVSHYANVVALISATTTGYLQRGWKVVAVGNIAGAASSIPGSPSDGPITLQQRIEAFRAMLFSGTAIKATFANDTLSGPSQPYDGLVSVLPLHMVTVSGDTKFSTSTDAGDTASGYYDSDSTHLRVAGQDLMASGGDGAACGYGAIV